MSSEDDFNDEFYDWLVEQPDSRIAVAWDRALRQFDEDIENDDPKLIAAVAEELNKMNIQDVVDGLVEEGLVQTQINQKGEIGYYPVS